MSEEVKDNGEKEIIEERVKPTVIRRRKKVVEAPVAETEPEAKPEATPEVKEPAPAPKELPGKVAKEAETPVAALAEDVPKETPQETTPASKPLEEKKKVSRPVIVKSTEPAPSKPPLKQGKGGKIADVTEEDRKKKSFNQTRKKEFVTKKNQFGSGDSSFVPRGRKRKVKKTIGKKTEITTPKAIKRIIKISEFISVGELAKRMGIKTSEVIKKLIQLGTMATVNQSLDVDTATLIASDFGYEVEKVAIEMEVVLEERDVKAEDLKPRPPVVTIMGHVDHGKTTLLDSIRRTDVTEGESGGITQHIGAYDVKLDNGNVVFLDTPGHEAFTAMRARGAKVTDLVVLVVAADDGVKPQTEEAIHHAKAAEVPIIVAINKMDKPEANPDRVKQELASFELVPEDWGGTTIFASVSAKEGTGIKELLEMILLQAEMMELKAAPDEPARGTIIEAKLDKGRGPLATVLIQNGTLKVGDNFVTGMHSGKVRGLYDDKGHKVKEAGPSIPVEVVGLSGVPDAGDDFVVLTEERQARQVSLHRQAKIKEAELAKSSKVTLDDLFDQIQQGEAHDLNIVLKADVHGSIEAIVESLNKLSTDKVKLKVIHRAVGGITESDVLLATASNAIVIGFHVRPAMKAAKLAASENVDIRTYSIIYDVVNDIRSAMEGMLSPVLKEVYLGRAEIRETYAVSRVGTIAGCYVVDGKIVRNSEIRVLRENVVIFEGKLASLKRFKDDAKEVATGYECGMSVENFNDIKVGDVIEAYTHEEEAGKL